MEVERIDVEELKGVQVLGRGGMGTVFLVVKEDSQAPLALKTIRKSASKKSRAEEILRRTETELDIASSLHHPFLSILLGVVETEKITGLLGEYCPGGDLHNLRLNQPEKIFSESVIRFYAAEIVIALEYLHSQGIAYRDLKPENILIQASGHIMLTDFDLSTRLSHKKLPVQPSKTQNSKRTKHSKLSSIISCLKPCHSNQATMETHSSAQVAPTNTKPNVNLRTRSKSLVGTDEYVAPEMLNGTGHEFAVDWWALGILLYEFLYGRTPFKGTTRKHTFYNILIQHPHFIGTWTPLRDLIIRLLEKEPSRRLGSRNGAQDIKQHSFFKSLSWDNVHCVSRPPFVPFSNYPPQHMMNNVCSPIGIHELVEMHGRNKRNTSGMEELPKGEDIKGLGVF
ncbi:hypothetical protein SUGI_0189560 [Cryptomeria japonica]|uniref:serine/threonine-protein kinase OXI1 n=1 Tax=Cryptomeria japonica TaxID=3369 RepID=UPI002408EA34|nr:serine/threonine-protein kinase OXI1 [Cryptomeria japonica]GLJ12372.1 hypothetical protein SUGI_0189560 [Cryptomeria japonica]